MQGSASKPQGRRGPDDRERACLRAHRQAASRAPARWVSRAFRLAAATAPADDPAACVSSSPEESKLFGLTGNDAVANTSSARQRQEGAGQTAHGAPRTSPADDLLPGMAEKNPLTAAATDPAKHQVRYPLRPEQDSDLRPTA